MKTGWMGPVLPLLWTFLPMYAFEKLANFYYLNRDPTFYLLSGWRLEVFIIASLAGSIASGAYLKDMWRAFAAQAAALAAFFALVFVFCDPRLCYSSGPDGLEPLRFGLFLGAVALAGCALGEGAGGGGDLHPWKLAAGAEAGFFAVGYYPVVFTAAGARLLTPYHPWGAIAALFTLTLATSAAVAASASRKAALAVPFGGLLLLVAASVGVATEPLAAIASDFAGLLVAVGTGAVLGTALLNSAARRRKMARGIFLASILLVLLMTVVIIPDAVSGVVPAGEELEMGTPVYVGAYQNATQGHSLGAMVTISFAGNNPSAIPEGNFLSAGFGIHSAGCCVDGIDYSYRFDLYMFHGGGEEVAASGWEACDDNAACGGHSWKILLLSRETTAVGGGTNVTLMMAWHGGAIEWLYRTDGEPFVNFTSYVVPQPENHDFNTGVSGGISYSEQKAAYFFQFGVMSRAPIAQGGWTVTMYAPSLLTGGSWGTVEHAATLQGADSYWKVIWRWGEQYPNVSVSSPAPGTIVLQHSALSSTPSFVRLW